MFVGVLVLVPAAVETVTRGKSVGRYATGTRVVRLDGGAIGLRHAFARALVGMFELWMTLGSVALLVALFGPRPRRLGDLLAGTFVQHERAAKHRDAQVLMPAELVSWASVADVSALPQRLENRLGRLPRRRRSPARAAGVDRSDARRGGRGPRAPRAGGPPGGVPRRVVVLRRERDLRALRTRAAVLDAAAVRASAPPPGFPADAACHGGTRRGTRERGHRETDTAPRIPRCCVRNLVPPGQ
ncbi:RDD family protein [Curtobacterium flaccumfaciens]|nr:RDD family protein [Curtobacterium flaccumfaciens]